MRESRVIALAGVFQACTLVRQMATQGRADTQAIETSIASVFRIDADSVIGVFGGIRSVRVGLETLSAQLDGGTRDIALTQLAVGVLRLARRLMRNSEMRETLRAGIESTQRQVEHLGMMHSSVIKRLSDLYGETLSQLSPRLIVHGNPLYLTQAQYVEQIRALLLAAIRAAVLWYQVGGGQFRLLLRRREYAMLARGLLARCMLGTE